MQLSMLWCGEARPSNAQLLYKPAPGPPPQSKEASAGWGVVQHAMDAKENSDGFLPAGARFSWVGGGSCRLLHRTCPQPAPELLPDADAFLAKLNAAAPSAQPAVTKRASLAQLQGIRNKISLFEKQGSDAGGLPIAVAAPDAQRPPRRGAAQPALPSLQEDAEEGPPSAGGAQPAAAAPAGEAAWLPSPNTKKEMADKREVRGGLGTGHPVQ